MAENCSSTQCGSQEKCKGCPSNKSGSMLKACHPLNKIRHVIAVGSGKGGVGKSSVTSLLALAAHQAGYKVGILDADITGPSIPKAFGLSGKAYAIEEGLIPMETTTGLKIMSINCLLDDPNAPVVWRGPVLAGVVTQFWTDVIWGELDYLFVDLPPGTGDVVLTCFQSIPCSGLVCVTTPSELVSMIVGKQIQMANQMNIPILGVIENMSYFVCPNCNEKHYIFGESHLEETLETYGLEALEFLPLHNNISKAVDNGLLEFIETNPLVNAFNKIKD